MKTLSAITEQTMSSREIAELTGKNVYYIHKKVKELINLLSKDDSVQNHKQYQDVRDNRGYVKEYLLNRVLSLTIVSEFSMDLRYAVIQRWEELEKAQQQAFIGDQAWRLIRADGVVDRKRETDEIKAFTQYATGQGSRNAKMYYMNITMMANHALFELIGKLPKGDTWRDYMSHNQLSTVSVVDRIINKKLAEEMEKGLFYKVIYQNLKETVKQYAAMIERTTVTIDEQKRLS